MCIRDSSQARDVTSQYQANVAAANDALATAEGAVADLQGAYDGIREIILQAGNASLNDADRRSLAADLRERFAHVLQVANRQDGVGRALFAGYLEESVPFVDDGTTVAYAGDQGVRALAISASRELPVGVSGTTLFQGIPVGNGTFETGAALSLIHI